MPRTKRTKTGKPPPRSRIPGEPVEGVVLPDVLVEGTRYPRRSYNGHEYILIPSIHAPDDATSAGSLTAIPERIVRFNGYPQVVGIQVRQQNRFLGKDVGGWVGGVTQWSITFDNVLVYCPQIPSATAPLALVDAQHVLTKLLLHPVRWQDQDDWQGRPCYYQGIPSRVVAFSPQNGTAVLLAEDGFGFSPSWYEHEKDSVPEQPIIQVVVDILSDQVWWTRTRTDFSTADQRIRHYPPVPSVQQDRSVETDVHPQEAGSGSRTDEPA